MTVLGLLPFPAFRISPELSKPGLEGQQGFVDGQLQLDAKEPGPRTEESEEVPDTQDPACLVDRFHLFLEHCAGGVAGEDQEGADGTLSGVKVFVKAAGWKSMLG